MAGMMGSPGTPDPSGPPPVGISAAQVTTFEQGKALYGMYCSECHGTLSSSTKVGKSFLRVSTAFKEIPSMLPLRNVLNDEDIRKIVFALDFERTAVCDQPNVTTPTRVSRLTRDEYFHSLGDVLGVKRFESVDVPAEPVSEAMFDNDSQALTVNSKNTAGYLSTAREAIDRAFAESVPSVKALLACGDAPGTDMGCLTRELRRLGRLAYRRPLSSAEEMKLTGLFTQLRIKADHGASVRGLLSAIFSSPHFLMKEYTHPTTGGVFDLNPFQLASRLAFFLWTGPPDDPLLDRAQDGSLKRPEVLEQEVVRMLADPRASRFATNFFQQWLGLRAYVTSPAPDGISPELQDAFVEESRRFFEEVLRGNLLLVDILRADFTYANAAVAGHYGLGVTPKAGFERVSLGGTPRLGFLGQGSFLTGPGTRTPTGRGQWILLSLLCMMPGEMPPAPVLSENSKDAALPFKERVALHASSPECRGCHAEMDPFGFALEGFDMQGRWRTKYDDGAPVITNGDINGESFLDHRGMVDLLAKRQDFKNCFTQKLVSYAVARTLSTQERCSANRLAQRAVEQKLGIRDLVTAVALDAMFTKNTGGL
jgi:hypothetical protein